MYCKQINYTKRQTTTKTLYCNCEFNNKFNPYLWYRTNCGTALKIGPKMFPCLYVGLHIRWKHSSNYIQYDRYILQNYYWC